MDNRSVDGTVQAIRGRYPTVIVLENGRYLGYAGGDNVGIHYALVQGADYALILNYHAILVPGALYQMVCRSNDRPHFGIVRPKVYHCEDPHCIQPAGGITDECGNSHFRCADNVDSERPGWSTGCWI